jgi:hypothetical protein
MCQTNAARHNTENSKQIFPEKELRGHSPNSYIYVSVGDLYIPTIGGRAIPSWGIHTSNFVCSAVEISAFFHTLPVGLGARDPYFWVATQSTA